MLFCITECTIIRPKQVQKLGFSSSFVHLAHNLCTYLNSHFLVISTNNYNHSHKYIYANISPRTVFSPSLMPYFFLVMSSWWDSTSTLHNLISLMFMKSLWRQTPYINAQNYDFFLHLIPTAQFLLCVQFLIISQRNYMQYFWQGCKIWIIFLAEVDTDICWFESRKD